MSGWQAGENYGISVPMPWQLGKQLAKRAWIIGNGSISLCVFPPDSFILLSALCPVWALGHRGTTLCFGGCPDFSQFFYMLPRK